MLKTRDVCMDFEPCSEVHNFVSVHSKRITPGQMTNLNMKVYVVVSDSKNLKLAPVPKTLCSLCGTSLSRANYLVPNASVD